MKSSEMRSREPLLVLSLVTIFCFLLTTVVLLGTLSTVGPNVSKNDHHLTAKNVFYPEPKTESVGQKPALTYKQVTNKKKSYRLASLLQRMLKTHPRLADDYFGFNVTRSDEIPVTRDVPDARPSECKNRNFNYSSLPTLSIVTPFHNEALTPLLRHVHAILSRTPPQLLMEIILVDDNSTFSYLGEDLQEYFQILDSRIQIIRNKERKGLILSRLQGEEKSHGEVVVFLDAHMEVCEGWAEPLLERIKSQPAIVVQADPIPINEQTIGLDTGIRSSCIGGFGWDMRYKWFLLPPYLNQFRASEWEPFPNPVLQGSCIAVRKSYFNAVGRFDPGLEIWGGEHFDLSFNVWMTGGRIETVPCSKVGHIYKGNKYSFGSNEVEYTIFKNNLRVSEVWMDEYIYFVRAAISHILNPLPVFTEAELRSLQERKKLRQERNSKSFAWFLKSVHTELIVPSKEDVFFGEIKNTKSEQCWFVFEDDYIGTTGQCGFIIKEQTFSLDKYGRLKYLDRCVGYEESTFLLRIKECPSKSESKTSMTWVHANDNLMTVYHSEYICAYQVKSTFPIHTGKDLVQLQTCAQKTEYQTWTFMFRF
ncbi:polypeptide N-acetylgalactosaminyltransferase 5-like isoform X1 [Haliotis rufescens]|uniref:polypeptide N-acetylgalactosaminyltransferase 5-like isoform X1 n=2 Tax=Haliotis rufescens TaxID=6454 RepID=UPI00201E7712|nr:polypeptide N-acetylgalactosaminyltransferase 5-like isoform X1 [Haliotis rufescens]